MSYFGDTGSAEHEAADLSESKEELEVRRAPVLLAIKLRDDSPFDLAQIARYDTFRVAPGVSTVILFATDYAAVILSTYLGATGPRYFATSTIHREIVLTKDGALSLMEAEVKKMIVGLKND